MNSENVEKFFRSRTERLSTEFPLTAVLYQDNRPLLATLRDEYEINFIFPLLSLNHKSRVLDIGCGTGRIAKAISTKIDSYIGIDSSKDFIDFARKSNSELENVSFEFLNLSDFKKWPISANRYFIGGVTQYLDDNDLVDLLGVINERAISTSEEVICYLRTSIALDSRFELDNVWSSELNCNYSAIYRTRIEMEYLFDKHLQGMKIQKCDFALPDELRNRAETTQFYWIIKNA